MSRRGFHILLGLTLVGCVLCPYVENVIHWDQTIFETGYDGETTVAILALILILAFALAKLLVYFVRDGGEERLLQSHRVLRPMLNSISSTNDGSPPLPLRI